MWGGRRLTSVMIAAGSVIGAVLSPGLTLPGWTADRLVVTQGSLSRGISVTAIKTYVETGAATENLAYYVDPLSPEEAQALRQGFQAPIHVEFLPFSQFLNTQFGEGILEQMATAIQPGLNPQTGAGTKALRGALIGAAEDGELSLLELVEHYPHSDLVLDQDNFDPAFQDLGMGLQSMLASVGLSFQISRTDLTLSDYQRVLQILFDPQPLYLERVEQFAEQYGLSSADLNSAAPLTGEITLSRQDLYQLYQDLQQIQSQALENLGVQLQYQDPADQ